MANRNLNALSRDPLFCVPYYWGPHYWGPIQRDPSYRDPFYQDPLFRDMVYRNPIPSVPLPSVPLARKRYKMTPSSSTTDAYQRVTQNIVQQNLILQQQLLQNQNQALMSAFQFGNVQRPLDLSSQKPEQSHQDILQLVETNCSGEDDPSNFQLLINVKDMGFEKVNGMNVDGNVVFSAGEGNFICSCKLPDEVDSSKLTFTLNRNGFLAVKAPRKVETPTSSKAKISVPTEMEIEEESKTFEVLNKTSEQKVDCVKVNQ